MTSPRTRLAALGALAAFLVVVGAGPAVADRPNRPGLVQQGPGEAV